VPRHIEMIPQLTFESE